MARSSDSPKTEAPTPRRREEFREKGQVALSAEFTSGLMLLCGCGLLWLTGPGIGASFYVSMVDAVRLSTRPFQLQEVFVLFAQCSVGVFWAVAPILLCLFVVAMVVPLLQVGFYPTWQPLKPDLGKISPIRGWEKLFSWRSVLRLAVSFVKLIAMGLIATFVLRTDLARVAHGYISFSQAIDHGWEAAIKVAGATALALCSVGVLDLAIHRLKHNQELRMTREEVKDERKQDEGDPHMRARLRRLQREMLQRRQLSEVPGATFVVRNPTHFAVALKYEGETMGAPTVVAKGADSVALKIIEIAEKNDVPVVENPPLARTLFGLVEPGQEIPPVLYQAVAEVLTYIYSIGTE